MLGHDVNRFGLSPTSSLSDYNRTADMISQIRFSQAHIYNLMTQFRIMSEHELEGSEKERVGMLETIKSEIGYLINTFEAYKKIRAQSYALDNIEGTLYSSYQAMQKNIHTLLQIASGMLGERF